MQSRRLVMPVPHGVGGEITLVALADQDAECPLREAIVAAVAGTGFPAKPPFEQLDRALQFRAVVDQHIGNQLPLDSQFAEATGDPLSSPAVELTPVLREQPRKASVINLTERPQLVDRAFDLARPTSCTLKARPELGSGPLAAVQVRKREPKRVRHDNDRGRSQGLDEP